MIARVISAIFLILSAFEASDAMGLQAASSTATPDTASLTLQGTVVDRDVPPISSNVFSLTWTSLTVDEIRTGIRLEMYMEDATADIPTPKVGEVCDFNYRIGTIEGMVGDGGSAKNLKVMVVDSFKCHARTKKEMPPAKNGDAGS